MHDPKKRDFSTQNYISIDCQIVCLPSTHLEFEMRGVFSVTILCLVALLLVASAVAAVEGSYLQRCDSAFCRILEKKAKDITNMKKTVVEEGACIAHFGQKADELCHQVNAITSPNPFN